MTRARAVAICLFCFVPVALAQSLTVEGELVLTVTKVERLTKWEQPLPIQPVFAQRGNEFAKLRFTAKWPAGATGDPCDTGAGQYEIVYTRGGTEQASTTYTDVVAGMKCGQNKLGDLECDYRVGRSLHFGIAGVGRSDGSIYFYASSFDGDYFTVVAVSGGCVIVRPGLAASLERRTDLAFVSPRNGRVYRTSDACRDAK